MGLSQAIARSTSHSTLGGFYQTPPKAIGIPLQILTGPNWPSSATLLRRTSQPKAPQPIRIKNSPDRT